MIYTKHTEVIVAAIVAASIARVMQLLNIQHNDTGTIKLTQLETMFKTDKVLKALEKANMQGDLTLCDDLLDSELDELNVETYIEKLKQSINRLTRTMNQNS